jgi:hypothetical protein
MHMFGKKDQTRLSMEVFSENRPKSRLTLAILASAAPIALIGCVTTFPMAPQSILSARSPAAWQACRSRVFDDLVARGEREGDSGGYVGASGSGARDEILAACSFQPMTRRTCDDAYRNAYLPCHERARTEKEYGLAMVELADVNMFNPAMMSGEKVESLCRAQGPISRDRFGALLCGE